jgi:hypothetical protein
MKTYLTIQPQAHTTQRSSRLGLLGLISNVSFGEPKMERADLVEKVGR